MKALRTLLLLALALTVISFTSDTIANIAGPLEYKGYLSFAYTEGEHPINHIEFTIDASIARDLLIVNVPSGWGYIFNDGGLSLSGGVLSLSGGSLNPGEIVNVQVSLNGHHPPGDYHIEALGTTTAGESVSTSGVLMVGEMYILLSLAVLNKLRYPLAGSTFVLGFLEIWWRTKRSQSETEVDLEDSEWVSGDELELETIPDTELHLSDVGEVLPVDPVEDFGTIIELDDDENLLETKPTTFEIPPELDPGVLLPGKIPETKTPIDPVGTPTEAVSRETRDCKKLVDECEKARVADKAAEAEAQSAKQRTDATNLDHEKAEKAVKEAQKKLDEVMKGPRDESESWIEMNGRRITSMDLKLRSDESRTLWDQYRNGEIDAKSLEEAWEELGEHSALEELRKKDWEVKKEAAEKALETAKEHAKKTEERVNEANAEVAKAEKKSAEVKAYADKICKEADDCVKVQPKKPTGEDLSSGGTVTGPGEPSVVDYDTKPKRKCKEGDRKERPAQDLSQEWEKYCLRLMKRFGPAFERRLMIIFSDPQFLAPFEYYVKEIVRGHLRDAERWRQQATGERFGKDFVKDLVILLENDANAKELLKYIDHFADEFARARAVS